MSSDDELQLVPDKKWWDQASVVSTIPPDIARLYFEIKKKFGIDIANVVYFARKAWGPSVARVIANRILKMTSFEEVIRYLEQKASMLDEESRMLIASLIYNFKYTHYFDLLLKEIEKAEKSNRDCPKLRLVATTVFHILAREGLFYAPDCIVAIVQSTICNGSVEKRCKPVEQAIARYVNIEDLDR